jgi:hypothetical protein
MVFDTKTMPIAWPSSFISNSNTIDARHFHCNDSIVAPPAYATWYTRDVYQETVRPQRLDVLLGRGRGNVHYPGNELFYQLIHANAERYHKAKRVDKRYIAMEIVQTIALQHGRFLRFDKATSCWVEVDEEVAILKAAHAFRYQRRYHRNGGDDDDFDDIDVYELEDTSSNSDCDSPPLLSDKEILAAIGWMLDDLTGAIYPMPPNNKKSHL